jgi:hypothetical protein
MKKMFKIVALLITLIIIVVVGLFKYVADGMCKNEIYKEYLSPDKSLKAVVFQRDCGATTDFSTQVSILKSNENLDNESGNIFIIKGNPDKVAPVLKWTNQNVLHIYYHLNGDEYKAKKHFGWFNSITIRYNN